MQAFTGGVQFVKATEPSGLNAATNHFSKRNTNFKSHYLQDVLTELEERANTDPANIPKWYDSELISKYNTQASFKYSDQSYRLHQRDALVLLLMRTCDKLSKLPTLLDTWTGEIDTLIFIGSSCVIPNVLKRSFIVQLPELNSHSGTSSVYKKTYSAILTHAFNKYGQEYDWFLFLTDENTYINVKYLRKYIHQLNNDDLSYIGHPNRLTIEEMHKYDLYHYEQVCMSSLGILLSSKLLSSIVPVLSSCDSLYGNRHIVDTVYDADRELGRCISRKLEIQCWAGSKEVRSDITIIVLRDLFYLSFYGHSLMNEHQQNKLFYSDSEGELSNPASIFNTQWYMDVISIHPVNTDTQMHVIHFYYQTMEYNNTKKHLLSISKSVNHICQTLASKLTRNDHSMVKLFKHCGVNFNEDLAEIVAEETTYNFTPRAREDVQSWSYFDDHALYADENINPKKELSKLKYHKRELEDVLLEIVRLANLEYPSPLEFHRLINGYTRQNGLKGNEYIVDAEFTEVNNPFVIVQRRFSLLKPLSMKFIVQPLKSAIDELVTLVVPVYEVADRLEKFLEMYENVALKNNENTRLVLVVYGEKDIRNCKSKLNALSISYPHSRLMMVQGIGEFSRAKALDIGLNTLEDNSLVFICDIDITITVSFLNRCRRNTIKGLQAYFPVMFKWYNFDYVYKHKAKPQYGTSITRATGHWGYYSYGMVCIYKSDYAATDGFDTSIFGWGGEDVKFFETVLKSRSNIKVFRSPDPGLTHRWHDKKCHFVDKTRYKHCLMAKAEALADKKELAQYVFDVEEKKTSQKFFCQ